MSDFQSLGLSEQLVSRLTEAGISTPTPIQAKAIPLVLEGRDVMGLAQTGTGKTAAFGLPIAQMLLKRTEKAKPRSATALILAPTRELAGQIHTNLMTFVGGAHLRLSLVVGGQSINAQSKRMERGAHILVATPGRLMDLIERGAISLSSTEVLVLDEADQMLDLGFIHTLRKIAKMLPPERQTLLFSATMPKQMAEIASAYLTDPVRVQVSPPGKTADKVAQSVHFVQQARKTALLINCLDAHRSELALVFARTKHGAERLKKSLESAGFAAGSIHGNKSQGQRDRALKAFRAGELTVLVATDVAARGIDIPDVRYVYNYDLPNVADSYVHRIGRTARAGASGQAVAFCAPEEADQFRDIQKLIKQDIPVVSGTPWEGATKPQKPSRGRPNSAPAGKSRRRRKPQRAKRAA